MGRLDTLYAQVPIWAQHATVSAYGGYWYWLRFGPGYSGYVGDYLERGTFSSAEWKTWQDACLRRLLHAATKIPHYQRTWSKEMKSAALAGRLQELPVLDKEPI